MPHDRPTLAVCSWSLRPSSAKGLADAVRACGLDAVQLALDPVRAGAPGWDEAQTRRALDDAGIEVVSGMMAPAGENYATLETIRLTGGVRREETWEANLLAARGNAGVAKRLGLALVTLHAGCVPEDERDPLRAVMIARLRELCEVFAREGVRVAFETGQDSPRAMLGLVEALRGFDAGVNFDPGNMILYGSGDPIDALRTLRPAIRQVHMKDATAASSSREWGTEVPAGRGEVDWDAFFATLRADHPGVDVVIEREVGEARVEDIRIAAALARRCLGGGE